MLKKRISSTIIGLPLVFIALIAGGWYLRIFLATVSFMGLNEFYTVFKNIDIKPINYIGYMAILFFYVLGYSCNTMDVIILIAIIIFTVPILQRKYNLEDTSITMAGVIYIIFFSYIWKIRDINNGYLLVWLIFIISWLTDTFAYFVGKRMGKRKLCPTISPNKTWEGSLGGITGSLIGCLIFAYLFKEKLQINIFYIIALSITGSVVAQIGDLFASLIKRNCNTKDFSKIIPGHGGVLDRFDSILFVSPYIYIFFNYVYK
ncbi:MAG TPA: phosphatidate cytidylyltransferase [Thermoanaerobacterium sp.]|nr:phosphatidate cytidylyltransferase [Thermoanaerobacterium sp.]